MACPYFFPTERAFTIAWPFPHRLPLGGGFSGNCRASEHEFLPDDPTLRDFCNLGHPRGCSRVPRERTADSVRFAVIHDDGQRVFLHYVYELDHAPVRYGRLEYDRLARRWQAPLGDACGQRQAECYLALYLESRGR